MENIDFIQIINDLRNLRDQTPCDKDSHGHCGCEQFDVIIDKLDEKQTLMHMHHEHVALMSGMKSMILKISFLIDMVEDTKHSEDDTSEHYLSDGETLDIVIDKLKLIINKNK